MSKSPAFDSKYKQGDTKIRITKQFSNYEDYSHDWSKYILYLEFYAKITQLSNQTNSF